VPSCVVFFQADGQSLGRKSISPPKCPASGVQIAPFRGVDIATEDLALTVDHLDWFEVKPGGRGGRFQVVILRDRDCTR
jgi:hypothetical protein